jgi:hypothetical protein
MTLSRAKGQFDAAPGFAARFAKAKAGKSRRAARLFSPTATNRWFFMDLGASPHS